MNDFRFASDSAGSSLLNWRIVRWDSTTGELVAYVNVGTLAHSTDTVIYLLFDGTARGSFLGGSLGAEYDANYKTVIDTGDGTTLDLLDRTTNANNGTNNNTATATAGPNGLGAISFVSGSSQYVSTPNTINYALATLEVLVYVSAPGLAGAIAGIVAGNGGAVTEKTLWSESDGKIRWYVYDGTVVNIRSTNIAALSTWHYVVGRADGTNSQLWVDGAQEATAAAGNTYTSYASAGLEINGDYNGAAAHITYCSSKVALVRLSNLARSNSYIIATSASYLSPSTFYTLTQG